MDVPNMAKDNNSARLKRLISLFNCVFLSQVRNPYTLVLRKAKNSIDELVAQEQVHKLNNQQEPEEMARRSNEATSMLKMTHTPSLCKKEHCSLQSRNN